MKALLLAAVTTTTAAGLEPTPIEFCTGIGNMAGAIMEARQMEIPMSEVMTVFSSSTESDQFYREVVIKAYEQPAYSSPEIQQRAVSGFRNAWEVECFKASAN
jgi:hypothetical protein